jgi:hypothetical protein
MNTNGSPLTVNRHRTALPTLPKFLQHACLLILVGAAALSVTAAGNPNPGILPINSTPHGQTYGQWAAAWWQWALSIPEAQNPVADTTGAFSGVGQSGPVWFLAGTFGFSVERTVAVPTGKSIFMPVHNWIFGSAAFDCDPTAPGVPCDVPTLRQKAADATTGAEVVEVWIDGAQVNKIRDYRALSPEPFIITLPEGAVFGIPAGASYPQVADGYWLMLTPFPKGKHTITVHVVNSAAGIDETLIFHLIVK